MNPILEKWLSERQSDEQRKRKDFLIKLGLIDTSKTKTVFKDALGNVLTEEEAKTKKDSGLRVDENVTYEALDLTDEEFKQVLAYAPTQASNNGEPTDHELLKRISKHTGIVSTILIIYVILSVIIGVVIGLQR